MQKFELAMLLIFILSSIILKISQPFYSKLFLSSVTFSSSLFCFLTHRKFKKGIEAKIWLLLGTGVLIWGIWKLFWLLEKKIFSHLFHILGYFPIIFSMLYYFSSIPMPLKKRTIFISTLISLIYGLSSLFLFIFPALIYTSNYNGIIISASYLFLDVYLIFGSLLLIEAFRGGSLSKVWLLISIAFIFAGIANTLFSYAQLGNFYIQNYESFLRLIGYFFLIYASLHERFFMERS